MKTKIEGIYLIVFKMLTPREKAILSNSLVSLVKACEGRQTQIDLRNESTVYGVVELVTVEMNVTLKNAIYENAAGKKTFYNQMTIRGNNIRFVQIPDSVDMIYVLQNQISTLKKARNYKEKQCGGGKKKSNFNLKNLK